MKVDDRTYFEEEQRMNSNWLWFFVIFSFISLMVLGVTFLIDKETDWIKVAIVLGAITFSDVLIIFLFKTMKLELAITKNGLHYSFFAMVTNKGIVPWSEVSALSFQKAPRRGYGKSYKFRYGEVYAMGTRKGIELELKNGKKKFFTLKDLDSFRSGFEKLNLPLTLNKELN